jgi:RNA 2',3'-cyclic 3'-phosphodiesterase
VTGTGAGFETTYVSGLRYDVFGNRTRARYGNGVESNWSFDPLMVRLEGARTSLPSGEQVQDLSYGYDHVGNPTSIESHLPAPAPGDHRLPGGGSWSFRYDGVDRLVSAKGSMELAPGKVDRFDQGFAYTKIHNLKRKTRKHTIDNPGDSGGQVTPPHTNFDYRYTYDSQRPHHAVREGDLEQRFDAAGHVVERRKAGTGSVQRMTWDDDGRLVEVQQGGTHLRNWYDSEGKRVIKRGRYGETLLGRMKKERLFVAVSVPPPVQRTVEPILHRLRSRCDAAGWQVGWVPLPNLHLTLQFLGWVEGARVDPIAEALAAIELRPPFEVHLAGIGAFPPRGRPRVLWLGESEGGDDLAALARAVGGCLETVGFSPESRPYHPHLTLGRVKSARGDLARVLDPLREADGGRWTVHEAVLYRSVLQQPHPVYEPLLRIPLTGS